MAGPATIEITGLDWVMKLLDADSATISANAVGFPPAASARFTASGTTTIVAPTWLITSENAVVSTPDLREAYNSNNPDQLDDLLAPDWVSHSWMEGVPRTVEGAKMLHRMTLSMFPDWTSTTLALIAEVIWSSSTSSTPAHT